MNLIAHRGYSNLAPENTISSFDLAIANGFKIFELDVQLTKDNVPVIFHDYDNTIMGFYKQFKRYGKSHPLMLLIHPEYHSWYSVSEEISVY